MRKFEDIKGFIFDLDGVIADTSIYHSKAWRELAESLDVMWSDELANKLKGISRMDSLNMILAAGNKENDYSVEEKEELAEQKNVNYLNLLKNMNKSAILPGIENFLEDLKNNGYLIALASASKNSPLVLEQLGLDKYFKEKVDPTKLSHGKPDPEIFIKAAEQLKLQTDQCIGIEDASAGISAINSAGELSVGIGNSKELNGADIIFSDTSELTLDNIKKNMK